jgi:hypothetical protein
MKYKKKCVLTNRGNLTQCTNLKLVQMTPDNTQTTNITKSNLNYEVLPKIPENLNIPRKPLVLRSCAARCLLLYISTISQPTCVFISACVSEFWLFPLHCFRVCLLISKWQKLSSKDFALTFASSLTKLQLKHTEC